MRLRRMAAYCGELQTLCDNIVSRVFARAQHTGTTLFAGRTETQTHRLTRRKDAQSAEQNYKIVFSIFFPAFARLPYLGRHSILVI